MREDGTAAILSPDCKAQLEQATRLRYFRSTQDTLDYEIKHYYRDTQRPFGQSSIKPIVVQVTRLVDQ
jgi:hypothetical protein